MGALVGLTALTCLWRNESGRGRSWDKIKSCDIGYALAANSCEGVGSVARAPSQPLMRSPLLRFQTPATPREAVGFSGLVAQRIASPSGSPGLLRIGQCYWTNPFNRRQLDATPAESGNASDATHKPRSGLCKTRDFCGKTPSRRGEIYHCAAGGRRARARADGAGFEWFGRLPA